MAAQTAQVSAKQRSELGSRANKRLRDAGLLPGVIYGHKEAVIPVTLTKKDVVGHLSRGAHVFDLDLDGQSEKVLVKEVQYDHLGVDVLHVDFARVRLDETVEITVSIELRGTPKGEADGGVLQQIISEIEVECLVTDIPEVIRHNIAEMALNDVLHVKDIKWPSGVRPLHDEDAIVASVREIAEEEPEAADAAATAEPEVIGRKPEDEAAPAEKK
jgi:large subunit ribosomal protein L25